MKKETMTGILSLAAFAIAMCAALEMPFTWLLMAFYWIAVGRYWGIDE